MLAVLLWYTHLLWHTQNTVYYAELVLRHLHLLYRQGLSLLHEQLSRLHISWGTSSVHEATVVGVRMFDPLSLEHLLVVRIFDPSSLDHLLVIRNTWQVA